MGFKDLFFQNNDVPDIPTSLTNLAKKHTQSTVVEEMTLSDFDVEGLDLANIVSISDIYAKEGIGDLARSIFKVEEIKSVVPPELPTESKRKTVLGMLNVSGLNVPELITDAELRINTLKSAQLAFNNNASDSVTEDEAKIADLESQIDILKQKISTTKKNQEAQNMSIDTELNRISDIVKFVGD
jgi:hypothetical protein